MVKLSYKQNLVVFVKLILWTHNINIRPKNPDKIQLCHIIIYHLVFTTLIIGVITNISWILMKCSINLLRSQKITKLSPLNTRKRQKQNNDLGKKKKLCRVPFGSESPYIH